MAVRHSLPAFALLIGMVGTATADKDRPKIAVLGLEATGDNGGVPDQATTKVARTLTNGLRSHAASARSLYALAPSSNRELIDEKLMKSCDSEKPECMTPIAKEVNADFLLFGRVDKTSENGIAGYRVSLKLLDVGKGKEQGPWKKFVAAGEATGNWAEEAYATVTGEPKELVAVPVKKKQVDGDSKLAWKATAVIAGAAGLVLSGMSYYHWTKFKRIEDLDPNPCPEKTQGTSSDPLLCSEYADGHSRKHKITGYSAIGAGAVAAVSVVAILKSSRSDKERSAQNGKPPKRTLTVTPIVAPDGGGATVRIDW